MDWDDLRVFLAVARAESLSAAGRRLGMDASTVGRRVARLETALGRVLFAGAEYASSFNGYMEGALRAAARAAQEVLDLL